MDIKEEFGTLTMGLKHKPHKSIIKRLDGGDFPLNTNTVLSHCYGYLGAKEFTRCHEMLQDKLPYEFSLTTADLQGKLQLTFMGIYNMIVAREKNHKNVLQDLAVDIVREMYAVPPHVDLKAFITDKNNMDLEPAEQDDQPPKLSPDRLAYLEEEIQKRIILNTLVQGSAMHVWKSSHYIVKEKIDNIDSQLIDLYDIFTTITGFQLWSLDINVLMQMLEDGQEMAGIVSGFTKQGYNQIKFDEPGKPQATVESHGVNFPVLLHEVTKGAIDYLICNGIPQDLSSDELDYYYARSDAYKYEPWHYYLSPTIWSDLLDVLDMDSQQIPKVIFKLSQLKYSVLSEIINCVIANPAQAKIKMQVWKII